MQFQLLLAVVENLKISDVVAMFIFRGGGFLKPARPKNGSRSYLAPNKHARSSAQGSRSDIGPNIGSNCFRLPGD